MMSVVLCLWAVTPALVCIFYFFHFSVGITLVSSDIMADVCPRLLDYIVVTKCSWLVLRPSYSYHCGPHGGEVFSNPALQKDGHWFDSWCECE